MRGKRVKALRAEFVAKHGRRPRRASIAIAKRPRGVPVAIWNRMPKLFTTVVPSEWRQIKRAWKAGKGAAA